MELTRRRFVGTGSLVTVAALAGCLDDGASPGSGTGNGDDDGNGNGDDGNETSGNGTGDGNQSADGGNQSTDGGNQPDGGGNSTDDDQSEDGNQSEGVDGTGDADGGSDESRGGGTDTTSGDGYDSLAFSTSSVPKTDADPLYTADEARSALPLEDWQDGIRDRVDSFLADTDFDSSVIVALRTRAPNYCYEFVLTEAEVGDDGVSVRATATDDDAQGACAQAVNGLWLLVRLAADGDVPDEGNVTIVDADGTEHGFGYARGSESASAGGGSSSSGNSTEDGDQSRLGSLLSR